MRTGAQALALLATPLVTPVLSALADGPKQQIELWDRTRSPAQTTLRGQLRSLAEAGLIERNRRSEFPRAVDYELTAAGRGLLSAAGTLAGWLADAAGGPLRLGESAAQAAVKALAEAWSTTMLRALAGGPLSLTELDRVIGSLSYPSLERRLTALRLAGLAEAQPSAGRGTPYGLTGWARRGAGPIVTAARWEAGREPERSAPLGRIEAETVLLLGTPLLSVAVPLSGSCRLAAEVPDGEEPRLAGVVVEVENGRVRSCTSQLQGMTDAWALGSPRDWLEAIACADTARIECGGDGGLAHALLDALHRALLPADRTELFGQVTPDRLR